jgi:hypothetical protein
VAIISVGLDKDFLTIQDAFNYASNGDTILIDEGEYNESLYFINKAVNLVGNTDYPSEGNVIIKPISNSTSTNLLFDIPLRVLYSPSEPTQTMYIEGVNLISALNSFEHSLVRFEQASAGTTSLLNIIFNKCILDASNGSSCPSGWVVFDSQQTSGYPISGITLSNCKILWPSEDDLFDDEFPLIPEKNLIKCILSNRPSRGIFGSGVDFCDESGTVKFSNGWTGTKHVDGDIISYESLDRDDWLEHKFPSPIPLNQFRVHGSSGTYAYNGSGFTLKASNTGAFSGEEVILYHDTKGQGTDWATYNFENSVAYSYIRVYNTGTYWTWKITEMECRVVDFEAEDYILIDDTYDFQYGPKYSSFITTIPPTHCFSGTVSLNNVPVSRELKIFRRDNGALLGSTTSYSGTGNYYFELAFGGHIDVVCSDDLSEPYYNDLIKVRYFPN